LRFSWEAALAIWRAVEVLLSPGPTPVTAIDLPPIPASSCSMEATMKW
jgi:hypothetical protein